MNSNNDELPEATKKALIAADAALRKCLTLMLKMPPSSDLDVEADTMDAAHLALNKIQPFLK